MTSRRARVGVVAGVCLVLGVSAVIMPLMHRRGLVGWDASFYLRQAAFFVQGRGVLSAGLIEPEPFVTWPLGYPLSVAAVAARTDLPVFWAGRLTGFLAALACVFLLVRALPRTGWVASLAFLSGGMLTTFAGTFAEAVFVLPLLASAVLLARVLDGGRWRDGAALGVAIGAAFCVRYIGIVLIGLVLLACGWAALRGRRRSARVLAASATGASVLVAGYMLWNRSLSGRLMPSRPSRSAPLTELAYEFAKAFASELNFVFLRVPNPRYGLALAGFLAVLALTGLLLAGVWRASPPSSLRACIESLPARERWTAPVLVITGLWFWISLAALRLRFDFNALGSRLLGPGTVLIFAGGLALAWSLGLKDQPRSKLALGALIVFSVVRFDVVEPLRYRGQGLPPFTEQMRGIQERYARVEPGSIVVRGPHHLLFLRPDLQVVPPRRTESREELHAILARARETGRPVWLDGEGSLRRLDAKRH